MCLSRIAETYGNPSQMIVDGWKLFGGSRDAPKFQVMSLAAGTTVPLNTWIKAEGKSPILAGGKSYDPGFHVYEDEDQARTYGTPRRVYVRGVRTKGDQEGKAVLVADEMYVPKDQNAWPPAPGDPEPEPPKDTLMDKIKKVTGGGKGGNA